MVDGQIALAWRAGNDLGRVHPHALVVGGAIAVPVGGLDVLQQGNQFWRGGSLGHVHQHSGPEQQDMTRIDPTDRPLKPPTL